ncbi:MAG: pitrilysin family protein [candidate division WOR-3 bacterium]|nr:pitrilysin family protein [candidate division WOR-3 bacterium]
MISYKKTVLPSGVTVSSENIPTALSTVIGIYITTGSRDEDENEAGISHFIEHSVFKGTKKRKEREISTEIESRGGILNASTSKEWTSFYAHVLPEELGRAIDVLSDLIKNPLFRKEDLDRERMVIQEEIKRFYDSPEDLLFFYTFSSIFGKDHPLSSPILGTPESVKRLTREEIKNFWEQNWTTDKMFVSAVGRVNHRKLCNQAAEKLGDKRGNASGRTSSSEERTRINIISKPELNHEYVALTLRSFPYNNQERFPLLVCGSILGSGMSSRLFQKLRQEMGLVYDVSAFSEFFSDTGVFGIYFSTDKDKLQKTLDAIRELLNSSNFSQEEVEIAKERLKGNIVLSLENNTNRMVRNAKEEIYQGGRISIPLLLSRIENVKPSEVREIKNRYLDPKNFVLTALGRNDNVSW